MCKQYDFLIILFSVAFNRTIEKNIKKAWEPPPTCTIMNWFSCEGTEKIIFAWESAPEKCVTCNDRHRSLPHSPCQLLQKIANHCHPEEFIAPFVGSARYPSKTKKKKILSFENIFVWRFSRHQNLGDTSTYIHTYIEMFFFSFWNSSSEDDELHIAGECVTHSSPFKYLSPVPSPSSSNPPDPI